MHFRVPTGDPALTYNMGGSVNTPVSLAAIAEASHAADAESYEDGDVWQDAHVMKFLRSGEIVNASDKRRVQGRAARYKLIGSEGLEVLMREMKDGSSRKVPPPHERDALVKAVHVSIGHMGFRRTAFSVAQQHWWAGIFCHSENSH